MSKISYVFVFLLAVLAVPSSLFAADTYYFDASELALKNAVVVKETTGVPFQSEYNIFLIVHGMTGEKTLAQIRIGVTPEADFNRLIWIRKAISPSDSKGNIVFESYEFGNARAYSRLVTRSFFDDESAKKIEEVVTILLGRNVIIAN
jgi:hypothetical protein